MNGLDDLRYMSSSSDSTGNAAGDAHLRAGHEPRHRAGAGPEQAAARDAAAAAGGAAAGRPRREVDRNFLLIIGLVSEDGSMTRNDISDYVVLDAAGSDQPRARRRRGADLRLAVRDADLARTPTGSRTYRLTPLDVSQARSRRRTRRSPRASSAALPAVEGQQLNATITAQTRLQTPEQFRDDPAARQPGRLAGAARRRRARRARRRELRDRDLHQRHARRRGIGVRLAAGANALETAAAVRARVDELSQYFPPGLEGRSTRSTRRRSCGSRSRRS